MYNLFIYIKIRTHGDLFYSILLMGDFNGRTGNSQARYFNSSLDPLHI